MTTSTDLRAGSEPVGAATYVTPVRSPDSARPSRPRATTTIITGQLAPHDTPHGRVAPAYLILRHGARLGGTAVCDLVVTDPQGTDLLALGPFDDDDVVAIWRGIGAASGLSLGLCGPDGVVHLPFAQLGRLQLGAVQRRRRMPLLGRRRPRFLVRRKSASLPQRPLVYREREIAAGKEGG